MEQHSFIRAGRALAASAVLIALAVVLAPAALARSAETKVAPPQASATQPQAAAAQATATEPSSRYAATIADGRRAAKALLESTGAPSLSLALISNGRVVWSQGFGFADKATLAPPGPATMYGIGSVSKMLATVAVMQLVDEGLVALDEPLATYLPAFRMHSPGYRDITVRMLLDHSSGFPGSTYGSAMCRTYWPGYPQYVLDTLAVERLKHTPGFLSVYCNDGFTMAELLVPAVTGKTFPEYVQDEIFTPLGMTHSAYPLEPFADGSYAKAYDGDVERPREVLNVLASGGLYSTPTDMGKLATMLANGGVYEGSRILSAASVADMGADQTIGSFSPVQADGTRYGLGWDSVTQPGLKAVGVTAWMKGGDSVDYHAGFVVAPTAKLSAVVTAIAPVGSGDCETLCERILIHALVDRGSLRRMPSKIVAAAPRAKRASVSQLTKMEGYWAGNGTAVRVEASATDPQALTLSLLMPDGAWRTAAEGVRLRTDGRFHAEDSPNSLWTIPATGRRYLVNRNVGGYGHYRDNMMLAQKLRPGEPLSQDWRDRVGHLWLAANELPNSATYTENSAMLMAVNEVPGLEGYVTVYTGGYGLQVVDPSASEDVARMFLQIPGFGSRDLNDAVVTDRGGEDWITYSSTVYRPLDSVPLLAQGTTPVTFGPEGYVEWRGLAEASSLTISAGTAWYAYDSDLNVLASGTTFPATTDAPAGAYLALFGAANSSSTVTAVPANAAPSGATAVKRVAPKLPVYAPPLQ